MGRRRVRGPKRVMRAFRSERRPHRFPKPLPSLPRIGHADRRSLLLGTALASTLLLGSLLAASPAVAVPCTQDPPFSPNPISDPNVPTNITCVNTDPRTNAAGDAIYLNTTGDGSFIEIENSGVLEATNNNN